MDDWALQVLTILEAEAIKASVSRQCEQDLRAKGVIR